MAQNLATLNNIDNLITIIACDFCGAIREQNPTRRFLENPRQTAVICDECVKMCVRVLTDPEYWQPTPAPPTPNTSDEPEARSGTNK